MHKNDTYFVEKIINDLNFISMHMNNIDLNSLSKNEILLDSMMFRMIQISENARKLSDEYREKNSNIPWNAIFGLRNRIVHDYGNIDLNIVFDTLTIDIPELMDKFSL